MRMIQPAKQQHGPSVIAPTDGSLAVGTPAVGTPAVGTPAVGTPAIGTPPTQRPSTEKALENGREKEVN